MSDGLSIGMGNFNRDKLEADLTKKIESLKCSPEIDSGSKCRFASDLAMLMTAPDLRHATGALYDINFAIRAINGIDNVHESRRYEYMSKVVEVMNNPTKNRLLMADEDIGSLVFRYKSPKAA